MTNLQLILLNRRIKKNKIQDEFNKISSFYKQIPLYNQIQFTNSIRLSEDNKEE